MNEDSNFSVQFLLSHNLPGSVTRLTADTATVLAKLGIPTRVLFPAVDWWDYKIFTLSRMRWPGRSKELVKLAGEMLTRVPVRRTWCGFTYHPVHPAVQARRFLATPSAQDWPDQSVTVVHPPYVVPHLLKTMLRPGIAMVGAVHVNLEKAMRSEPPEAAAWYTHWVAFERFVSMPRYATSHDAKDAAERLGIPIRKVIYNGIDLDLFHPGDPVSRQGPTVITLYCDPNVQKGLQVGLEAFKGLTVEKPGIRLCSIGHVTAEQGLLFDRNYGYLHGEAYADALRTSDIFVYPSLYDGFPAPPLQAMASGTALVTTAVEGLREYAVHGRNALVCEPGNADALRAQIVQLVHGHTLRERLRANGPITAEAFSVEHSSRQLLEFLNEVYEEQHDGVAAMVGR